MRDRILIIGSERDWGEQLVPVFESAGFSVARAPAVPETLARLDVVNPDMVILDEGVTDSLDVCYRYATEGVPVILVGDDPSKEIWSKALGEAGADFYLRNPIDHDVLIARVRAILRRYKKRRSTPETLHGG
jgi:two-component system, OmpR family, response regulator